MLIMKINMMKYSKYISLVILLMVILSSCNKDKNNPGNAYMGEHDMYYTKFYKAYSPNPVFKDKMTNQLPAEGAISRGNMPFSYPTKTIADRAVKAKITEVVFDRSGLLFHGRVKALADSARENGLKF